jgi:hypothetical protein
MEIDFKNNYYEALLMGHRIRIKRREDMFPFYSHMSINESQAEAPPPTGRSGGVLGVRRALGAGGADAPHYEPR